MLETQRNSSGMSEDRATEIINFLEKGSPTKFGNVKTPEVLESLATAAYETLGKPKPAYLDELIQNAGTQLGKNRERLGLDIGPDRARFLVNHLLGRESDPKFRQEDDITKKREVLRKALATVARIQEQESGDDTTHRFIVQGDNLIEEKYPMN